ncbi:MAG TPA: hypothetical protein VKQ08_11425 [Cyclobacteriaceae bacterium]|nr:hypothetical protein [Cyclobacteriaceae bacterium]
MDPTETGIHLAQNFIFAKFFSVAAKPFVLKFLPKIKGLTEFCGIGRTAEAWRRIDPSAINHPNKR